MIDEDSFQPEASINTTAFDLKVLINLKKAKGIPQSPRIRTVWILKQYLYRKKKSMGLRKEAKNERFSKEKNVSPKERHGFSRKKGMNDHLKRKVALRFIIPPIV